MDIIMLAAGTSSRMGSTNKMLIPFGNTGMCSLCCLNAVKALEMSGGGNVIVVEGYRNGDLHNSLDSCFRYLSDHETDVEIKETINDDYEKGQFSSLKTGVRLTDGESPFFVSLADMPYVKPSFYCTIVPLLENYDAVRPFFKDENICKPGHPVLIDGRMKNIILNSDNSCSMGKILDSCNVRKYYCSNSAWITDIDTPEDL